MPRRSLKPCAHPACGTLTRERHCPTHARTAHYDARRGSSTARGYDRRWRKLRERILFRDPICRTCRRAAATEVDHIIAKARGGTDHPDNLQGLCRPCHSRKSVIEDGGFGRA